MLEGTEQGRMLVTENVKENMAALFNFPNCLQSTQLENTQESFCELHSSGLK